MSIAYFSGAGNAYTGGVSQWDAGTEGGFGSGYVPVAAPVAGQSYWSDPGLAANGIDVAPITAYDDTQYSSSKLAYLDNLGGQNGQTSKGLAAAVTSLGLDPDAVQQGLQAWSASKADNNINWLGSPAAYLSAAAQGNPALAGVINPYVAANQNALVAGQAATALATQQQHSPQSMHTVDYENVAEGIALIASFGAAGGAFAGEAAAGEGGTAAGTGAFDLGGSTGTGIAGSEGASSVGTGAFDVGGSTGTGIAGSDVAGQSAAALGPPTSVVDDTPLGQGISDGDLATAPTSSTTASTQSWIQQQLDPKNLAVRAAGTILQTLLTNKSPATANGGQGAPTVTAPPASQAAQNPSFQQISAATAAKFAAASATDNGGVDSGSLNLGLNGKSRNTLLTGGGSGNTSLGS